MKSKLIPLALLIPAVVLAQPSVPPQPQVIMPIPNVMQAPSIDPTRAAKAASALSNAKKQSNATRRGTELGDGNYDSWTYVTAGGGCPSGYHVGGYTNIDYRVVCTDAITQVFG